MAAPLKGIRVIDFGRFIAAPYCGMLLADLGADVIRVERREGGEDRALGPVTETGEGGLFLNMNRNKRGITLDIGKPQSRPVIERLVQSADIVIVNLPLVMMKKLRLDYDSLRAVKEDVILVMVSAFGPDGPYADRVGFDTVVQGMSGAMSLTGFPDVPVRSIVPFADYGTALHGAYGAMVALYQREKTGEGRLIDVSLLSTSMTFMLPFLAERATSDIRRGQMGNTSFYTAPSDTYKTRDGWIMVPTVGDWMFGRWAKLMGRPEFIEDERFGDDISRANHHTVINEVMGAWCAERTTEDAMAELERSRIPCGEVYDLDGVLADPHVKARGLLEEISYPDGARPVPISATPVRLSGVDRPPPRRPPTLGEHTDEVLAEVGFSEAEIAAFRRDEVV